ncbi:MAG: hypothetical protein V4494_00790 [Chlamydiota bacterium]
MGLALLASVSAFQPSVIQDMHGNRVILWMSLKEEALSIHALTAFKEEGISAPIVLSTQERSVVSAPKIVMNNSGQILAAWNSYDSSARKHCLEVVTYAASSGWSSAIVLSDSNDEDVKIGDVQLSLDDEGHIAIVWTSTITESLINPQIRLATGTLGKSWSTPVTISGAHEK